MEPLEGALVEPNLREETYKPELDVLWPLLLTWFIFIPSMDK